MKVKKVFVVYWFNMPMVFADFRSAKMFLLNKMPLLDELDLRLYIRVCEVVKYS